jgi:phage shock protein A
MISSKPFQTTVKENYRQATEWTPANIKKDPVGYLSWALNEVGSTEKRLEASVLGMKTRKGAIDRALNKHRADASEYEKLFNELKDGYRTAAAAQTWPVKVRDISFDESALKRKVVECNDKIKNTQSLAETYNKTRDAIDGKLREVDAKLAEVVKLKSRLATDLEIARVNKSVEGLDSLGDTLNSIVDTSSALAQTAESSTSVDEMIRPSNAAKIDEEFAKLLSQ